MIVMAPLAAAAHAERLHGHRMATSAQRLCRQPEVAFDAANAGCMQIRAMTESDSALGRMGASGRSPIRLGRVACSVGEMGMCESAASPRTAVVCARRMHLPKKESGLGVVGPKHRLPQR